MIRKIKSLLLAFPGFDWACRALTRRHVRAFMYHRFCNDDPPSSRRTSVALLRRQLAYLASRCQVVDPDEQARVEDGPAIRPVRPLAVITVDDGYADFHDYAFPVLRELGIPATLFVTTGFVDGTCWMWWDRIRWALEHTDQSRVEFSFREEVLRGELTTDAGRSAFWQTLVPALRFVADGEKEGVVAQLAAELAVTIPAEAPPRYAPTTWAQIVTMAEAGVTMGAHTRTHPILSQLDSKAAMAEIVGCRDDLAARLGWAPKWFAYPQGGPADFNAETESLVAQAGFSGCYVAYLDLASEGKRWARHRYNAVSNWTDFRWTVSGADYLVLKLRRLLGLSTCGVPDSYWQGKDLVDGPVARSHDIAWTANQL